jgi:hypothetical protein
MPTHYGIQKRSKPRLRFVKGFDGQNSLKLQENLFIYNDAAIMSGMIVSKFWNTATSRYEWKIGLVAGATPYIADQDYDDSDVIAAGGILTAYPLSSEIEVQTPYVVDADGSAFGADAADLLDDAALACIAAGSTGAGSLCLAEALDTALSARVQIVGYASGGHHTGLIDVAAENTNVTRDADGKVLVLQLTANFSKGNLTAA